MAQHIPLRSYRQKNMRKIHDNILKDFKNMIMVKGSLKYERANEMYEEHKYDEVYLTNRYIGKGFIYFNTYGSFEIHYNSKIRSVAEIYMVA